MSCFGVTVTGFVNTHQDAVRLPLMFKKIRRDFGVSNPKPREVMLEHWNSNVQTLGDVAFTHWVYLFKHPTSVNQNEDAQVADAPDKRAPDINRQVHAQADPDKEARVKAPRSGPHP